MLLTTLTLSLSPLSSPAAVDAIELRFAPEIGAAVTTSVAINVTSSGGDLAVVMNDQEVPAEFLPELSFSSKIETEVEARDTFGKAPDGAVGPWRVRRLEAASQSFEMELDMGDAYGATPIEAYSDGESPLEGLDVAIGRDGDDEVVAEWVEDDELDDSMLEGLRPELDMAALLPDESVEIGDSWEADAAALAELLQPGGDLAWQWSNEYGESTPDLVLDGSLTLTLSEVSKDDGTQVGRIEIEGEFTETLTRATTLEQVPVVDGTATEVTTTDFTVEGELVWNLDRNVLASCELEGSGSGEAVTTKDPNQDGPTYRSTTRHETELKIEATATLDRAAR